MKFITGLSNVLFTEKGCTITIKLPKDQTDEHRDFLRSIHGGNVDIQESQGLLRPMRPTECEIIMGNFWKIEAAVRAAMDEMSEQLPTLEEIEDGPEGGRNDL